MNNKFVNNLIYEKKNSLPGILCDEIIKLYEEQTDKHYPGSTFGGINPQVKDTTDMLIPKNEDGVWKKIERTLYIELQKNVKIYIENLMFDELLKNNNNYKLLGSKELHIDFFMIQKYNKSSGKYIYHDDFCADFLKNRYRVLTYIWYLNTVEEGGQTEFFGNHLIKPEKGKLLLFPSSWTFPHCGKVPISSNKYIITGWFYLNNPFI